MRAKAKPSRCAVCDATRLRGHLRVAGPLGSAGLIPTTSQFGTALADIVRCERCGHMQLDPMPADAGIAGAYAVAESDDYIDEERGQRATARRALAAIEAHRRPGFIADLGCWVGFLLDEARLRGWRTVGIEPSEFASAYARDRLGLDVRTGDLLSAALPPGALDAVVMGDVIEHLIDPGQALERIRELLARDGVLWMALPDAGSAVARLLGRRWWSIIPTHVQYFTRASVRALLHRHGFEVLELATAPKAFTVDYYVSRTAGYSAGVASLLRRAVSRLGLADRLWAPDFRDRMYVVARKREAA